MVGQSGGRGIGLHDGDALVLLAHQVSNFGSSLFQHAGRSIHQDDSSDLVIWIVLEIPRRSCAHFQAVALGMIFQKASPHPDDSTN